MGIKLGKMTFGGLFKKPETILYPIEKKEPPAGLKGTVANSLDTCILCSICAKVCVCGAIKVDKAARTWAINHYQCVQCGFCVRECPKKCLEMTPKAPLAVGHIDFETFTVPEQPKKEKPAAAKAEKAENAEAAAPAIEPTGDPEMDAKLASMDPAKAAKLRAAYMAKKAKEQAPAIEPTGDPEMDKKLAAMDPEKAAKVRAAYMAKKAKEEAAQAE